MTQINVNTSPLPYAVICRRGVLARAGAVVSGLHEYSRAFALSSPRVWRRWGGELERSFAPVGGVARILFDDREAAKNLRTVEALSRQLARAGADRRALLVALGGGVVGDVAGFVAACYQRGVRVVHVPTTLVSQVDSAIGGKTGVNLPEGKNLVGAFHQPRLVVADPQTLDSLPARQYRSGVYEVIKYGVLGDPGLFARLEKEMDALLARDPALLDWVIPRCIAAKAHVVEGDEREAGPREILNLGHTFAHALETVTRYRRFLHGEAVGWGLCAAARLSRQTGLLEAAAAVRIERLVRRAGPLPPLRGISAERILAAMQGDKKVRAGRIRFILPVSVGAVEARDDIPRDAVVTVWTQLAGGK